MQKINYFKVILGFVLSVLMVITLFACGNGNANTPDGNDQDNTPNGNNPDTDNKLPEEDDKLPEVDDGEFDTVWTEEYRKTEVAPRPEFT